VHRTVYDAGRLALYALDSYLSMSVSNNQKEEIIGELVALLHEAVAAGNDIVCHMDKDGKDKLQQYSLMVLEVASLRDAGEEFLERLSDALQEAMHVLDIVHIPLVHAVSGGINFSLDWDWLKSQLAELSTRGFAPCGLMVMADGTICLGQLGPETYSLGHWDLSVAVPVSIDHGGCTLTEIHSWDELKRRGFANGNIIPP
jgi:hypothetical protein